MAQMGFYINQSLCSGCKACTVACKDKKELEVGQNFRRVYSYEEGAYIQNGTAIVHNIKAFYFSISCNHCQKPKCVPNCPTGAIIKRPEDGITLINQDKCRGTKFCVSACPYGAPQYNEKLFKANKCDFCLDLIKEGGEPVCVSTCIMRAIEFGPIEELREKYGNVNQVKGMPSGAITNPSLVITPHKDAVL